MTIIELVLSLAAILGAAILFTNAVEIMGDRLNLGAGAVGSVLAAVGTVLQMIASERIPASLVAPPQYSQMLWAVALDYLLFGIRIDLPMILGSLVIIGSGLFIIERERVRRSREPPVHPR